MFLAFYFKFTFLLYIGLYKTPNKALLCLVLSWQTIYFQEDLPPPSPPQKKIKYQTQKGSFLSPEVPACRADEQIKCLTKNSGHDLLLITDVRWQFQNAIDRFVFNASFFRSCPNGHKLTNFTIWSQRDKCILFLQIWFINDT